MPLCLKPMDEKNYLKNAANGGKHFYIEAAINEEGPKKLKVEQGDSANEYLVYHNDVLVSRLKQTGDEEWEQSEGTLTPGISAMLGNAISRLYR